MATKHPFSVLILEKAAHVSKDLIANIWNTYPWLLLLVNTAPKNKKQYNSPVLLEDDLEFLWETVKVEASEEITLLVTAIVEKGI